MLDYKCDITKSKEIFEKYKEIAELKPNNCYNNVFNLVAYLSDDIKNGGLKIAYGYMNVKFDASVFVRHCFFVDSKNKMAIDPTIGYIHSVNKYTNYKTFKEIDDVDKYIDYILSDNNYPALANALLKEDLEAKQEAFKQGYIFLD